MKVLYRITDSKNGKNRPKNFDKKRVFLHFLKCFPKAHSKNEIYVFGDNISDETYDFLCKHVIKKNVYKTSLGNSESYLYICRFALKNFAESDINEKVYFAEDDYIYTENAEKIIEEGLEVGDYVSGYDHPDKYTYPGCEGTNPFVRDGGEDTRVILSDSSHWKYTNSMCMTFATKLITIYEDYELYERFCKNYNAPYDFQMCLTLKKEKGRRLLSCIPSVSTHCETVFMAKFIDWDSILENMPYP